MATGSVMHQDPWSMEVTEAKDFEPFEIVPSGTWTAVVVGLFDVGSQPETDKEGKAIDRRKLYLVYELLKKRKDGSRYYVGQLVTWSMNEKATLYGLACSLLGIKPQPGSQFDPRQLLGQPVLCEVIHSDGTSKKGKAVTYSNLEKVSRWQAEDDSGNPKPIPEPAQVPMAWSVVSGEPLPLADLAWVPRNYGQTLGDMVRQSTQYREGTCPPIPQAAPGNGQKPQARTQAQDPEAEDEDIPF